MSSNTWGEEIAEVYDATSAAMYDPAILDPTVELLARLAGRGPVLELAIGTGRVAIPLSQRGIEVHGIDLSSHMVKQLREKSEAEAIHVVVGNMTTTKAPGKFTLVYLVWNAIGNVTTQAEQTATFCNATSHLVRGGRFVVEVVVPQLRRLPPGEVARVFQNEPDHVGIDTLDDPVGQIATSHHWMRVNGRLIRHSAPYRYVWPSELDLMAQIAGLEVESRYSDWNENPFTSESENQVAVFILPNREQPRIEASTAAE